MRGQKILCTDINYDYVISMNCSIKLINRYKELLTIEGKIKPNNVITNVYVNT